MSSSLDGWLEENKGSNSPVGESPGRRQVL